MLPPGDFSKFLKKIDFSKNWSKSVFNPGLGRFGFQIQIQREKLVLFMGSNHYFFEILLFEQSSFGLFFHF